MSTQPLNIISRYGEDDISLWMVNVEFEDYKRVAGNAVQLKVNCQDKCSLPAAAELFPACAGVILTTTRQNQKGMEE